MLQDGNVKTERELLVSKLQRHIATLQHLSPIEDASLITQCQDIIRVTKEQLILLHSPQDQLRNVQSAIARNNILASDLSTKICNFQKQETLLKDKIAEMMLREQQLLAICQAHDEQQLALSGPNTPPDAEGRPSQEQYMQLQAQLSALHCQYSADQATWKQQIRMLALVPNLPEDAVKLMPVIPDEAPAAPPTPTGLHFSSDEEDPGPPVDALLNGFEDFHDTDVMYGPRAHTSSSSLRSRSVPYAGPTEAFLEEEETPQTPG